MPRAMQRLASVLAVGLLVLTGFSSLVDDSADAKMQTYPVPSLPPSVPNGSEISNGANFLQHLNNGDTAGMLNDAQAYIQDKGVDAINPKLGWLTFARDTGIYFGEMAMSAQQERSYNWYKQMKGKGFSPADCAKMMTPYPQTLSNDLYDAWQKNPFPIDGSKEMDNNWRGNANYMAAGFEVKIKFDAYVAQNTHKAQNDMLSNAGNSLHEFGNQTVSFIQWVWNGWFPPKPPVKPPEKPPAKPPVKPPKPPVKPPQKPPSNPAGDHPDDNQDVSTFQVTRERSLFNAYERLAQMRNDPDIIREMEQIRTMDRNVTENMVPNWRSEVWYISSQLYDYFTQGYEEFVAGLPEKALDAMDKYTLTITQKDLGMDIGKKIPDTTVRPFSMRAVKKAFEEEPSFVYSIMESYRAGIDDILKLPRVAVLQNGYWQSCGKMMADSNEPVLWVDANFENGTIAGCSVLIIPSGGLYGLDGSENLRSKLDRFVRNGGTLIVLAQQHGTDYGSVPGGLSGYGWIEDQSCQYNSVGITTYVPFLSGQDSPALSLNVDGYFTGWPENSTIVLSRTKNAQPALLMYPHGKGRVVATSAYEDWAYDNHAASASGKKLIRDLVAWAVAPAELPEFAVGTGAISLTVPLENPAGSPATKVVFTLVDPDRAVVSSSEQSITLPHNSTGSANWSTGAEQKSGIWWLDYALYNATGALLRQAFDAQRFAVSKYKATPGGFSYHFSGVGFDITTESEYVLIGSDANFTVHIYNYDNETKNITVKFDWTHQILDQATVTVPPNGKVDVNWTRHDAGSGRMWAWFYDESGRQLGVASKGVWGTRPTMKVEVSADATSYGRNGTVRAEVKVSSNQDLAARTTVSLLDEMNGLLASETLDLFQPANFAATGTVNLTIPETAMSGYLLLTATAEAYSNRGAGSTRLFYLGANGTLSGRVYDLVSNNSIPNAEVRLEGSWKTFTVRSDMNGNYQADVPGAYYRMVVSADGFNKARATVPVRPFSNNTRDIATTPGGNQNLTLGDQGIQGRVLTLLDEQGIAGASVVFNLSSNQIIAEADADGRYSMLLPAGVSRVAALYDDLYSGETEAAVFSGRVTELDLFFEAAIQTGRVLDIVYGTPVADALLVFDGGAIAMTDKEGRYRFPLVVGYHTVKVSAADHMPAEDGLLVSYRAAERDFHLHPTQNWTTGVVRDLVYENTLSGVSLTFDGGGAATTDSEGRYRILLPTGYHKVDLSAPGYENLPTGFHLAERSSDYDFWLKPLTRAITGTVRDLMFESPVAGADLSFDGAQNVTADAAGSYALQLATGYHSVLITKDGYEPVSTGIHVAPRSSPYDFMLKPLMATINGTVRDLIYEFPISGAFVSFDGTRNTTTDGSGRYTMFLPTGYHSVTVVEKSYTTLVTGIHVAVRNSDYDFYLTPPAFNLSFANGTVRDLVYGTPLSGVQLVFDGSLPASTDGSGKYSRGLATGYHSVTLSLPGYDNLTTGLHLGGRASDYDFWLTPNTRTVTGTVNDIASNAPVSGAGVEVDGRPAGQTDAAGGFSATIPAGTHNIAFVKAGYSRLTTSLQVSARTGPQTFLLMPNGYTPPVGTGNLTGHVYDLVSGQPVPGTTVWLDGWDRATTDRNGSYSIPYSIGNYRLILRTPADHEGYDNNGYAGVTIYPGKNSTVDFYQYPVNGNLTGTVFDVVSGKPIPGIRIWYAGWDRTTTDGNGTYSFTYAYGVNRILLRGTADYDEIDTYNQPAGIAVYSGRSSVMDFYMNPVKGTLSGTVYDAVTGKPVPGIGVWYAGWDRTTTDQNGSYSFTYDHGVNRILLRGTDDYDELDTYNQPAGVAIYRGRTSVMDFCLEPRKGVLSGTVHDVVSGRPISGIGIWYAGWDRTVTDQNGSYSFTYYWGVNRLLARGTDDHDELDTYNRPAGIAIYRGRDSVMDLFMEPRKGTLSGTAYDVVTGKPAAGVGIWYDGWDRAVTDGNGSYSFTYYHGVKRLLVRDNDGYTGWDTSGEIPGVGIYRGTQARLDLYVTPRPAPSSGTIAGRVLDLATGAPINATFTMGGKTASADENGTYSLTLPGGLNTLTVRADGYETRTMMVNVPLIRTTRMDIWLTLLNGTGTFKGTVVDKSGNRTIPGAQLTLYCGWPEPLSFNLTTGSDGSFSAEVPTRSYAITVNADGFKTSDGGVTVFKDRTAVRKLLMDRSGNFTPWPAEFELITLPQYSRFFIGDMATLDVRMRNIGDLVGEAQVNLSIPGIYDELGTAFILPNSEDVVRFQFMMPDDLEEKRYKAYYTVLGTTYERNITVVGMKLDVSASLDKRMYLAGDAAAVTLSIANLKNFDGQFFSRVKYGDYDMSTPFNLSARGNATLTFQVPVKNASLERLFYSVYFASGRSLYINSMYVFVKPAGDILLYTDKQVYKRGETVQVTLESASAGKVTISTDWFNTTVDVGTTKSVGIPLPRLRSGTYFITYVSAGFRGSYPFDAGDVDVTVKKSAFKSATLDLEAEVEIELDADSNLALQGSLNLTVIDPAGNEVGFSERPWNLSPGENRGLFSVPFLSTEQTGIHSVAYTLFADLDGKRTPLFSGRRAFDAVDRAAPNVTGTFPSKTRTKSIVVTIYTNEKTTCVVEYGAGESYGKVAVSTLPGRIHSVVLANLSEGKTYHYRVKATDMSGNEVVYRDMTAKTSVPVAVQPGTDPLLAMALVVVVIGTVIGGLVIRRRPR